MQQQQHQVQVQPQGNKQVAKEILFKFSQQYKLKSFKVLQQGNVVEGQSEAWGFCVCEPSIPSNGTTRVAFKILKTGEFFGCIYIGLCQRDIIKQANYNPDINDFGHGSYLIDNYGNSFSHNQQKINVTHKSFEFNLNDIIMVEVDNLNKKVTWIKNYSSETFTMRLDLGGDLCYCVRLFGYNDSSVEIMNEIADII